MLNEMPTAQDWLELALKTAGEDANPTEKTKARWDAMAPGYANKPTRSGYLAQLQDTLALEPGESVFDMGCGPGVLAIPLAQTGHEVFAVDFSDGMHAELQKAIEAASLQSMVHPFKRAWQEDWSDLPTADVAVSSRSMTTRDYADAVAKLESKARRRVVVTTAAGETPWLDLTLRRALGRDEDEVAASWSLIVFLNYLLQSGRFPSVSYICHGRTPSSTEPDELKAFLRKSTEVRPEEEEAFERFVAEHMICEEDGRVHMNYEQHVRWAVVSWDVPQS